MAEGPTAVLVGAVALRLPLLGRQIKRWQVRSQKRPVTPNRNRCSDSWTPSGGSLSWK